MCSLETFLTFSVETFITYYVNCQNHLWKQLTALTLHSREDSNFLIPARRTFVIIVSLECVSVIKYLGLMELPKRYGIFKFVDK